jgi:hypothetical protein
VLEVCVILEGRLNTGASRVVRGKTAAPKVPQTRTRARGHGLAQEEEKLAPAWRRSSTHTPTHPHTHAHGRCAVARNVCAHSNSHKDCHATPQHTLTSENAPVPMSLWTSIPLRLSTSATSSLTTFFGRLGDGPADVLFIVEVEGESIDTRVDGRRGDTRCCDPGAARVGTVAGGRARAPLCLWWQGMRGAFSRASSCWQG